MPTPEQIKRRGRFLGYQGYDEVYLFYKKKYVLLDYLDKNKKLCYHVHRWYGRIGNLINGYNELTGNPL